MDVATQRLPISLRHPAKKEHHVSEPENSVKIDLPEIDLKYVQTLGSLELKDERGRSVGQYFFGKGQGRTVFLFGKYKGAFKTHAECQAFIVGVLAVISERHGQANS